MNNTKLTKCDFCGYKTISGCMVTPNSYYCKKAIDEYYQHVRNNNQTIVKSLRPWEKK